MYAGDWPFYSWVGRQHILNQIKARPESVDETEAKEGYRVPRDHAAWRVTELELQAVPLSLGTTAPESRACDSKSLKS